MSAKELDYLIERYEQKYREDWEKLRLLIFYVIAPYASNNVHPADLFKFSWEKDDEINLQPENIEKIKDEFLRAVLNCKKNG